MAKDKQMTEDHLVGLIGTKVASAMNDDDGELSETRRKNLNYYLGQPYGNEREGYSKYVTREVLEAIEWAMPSIIRVFASGDKVVQFDPVTAEDEHDADRDTDTINHLILKQNDGYEAIYAWCKDALMFPNAYVKVWVDESEEVTAHRYDAVTEEQIAAFAEDDELEIEEQESYIQNVMGMDVELFRLKVKRTRTKPQLCFEAVPPEQVLVDDDLTSQDMDEADFVAHRVRRSYTDLVNMGYDRDKLDLAGGSEDHQWNDERVNRLFYEDENPDQEGDDDDSMRQLWVHECYMRVDFDGDGLAEQRRVVMIGGTIFDNEEWSYQPFISMSSLLMPHKHTGLSLADLARDQQMVASTLMRQLLDNTYRMNIRRKYVGEDALTDDGKTVEALMDATSEFIPCRNSGAIVEESVQPIIGDILPVLQQLREETQVRTGVTPNMALDPEVLQQSTLGAFSAALAQASQRVELITRTFAETGFKRLFRKAHRLCREFMDHELQFKLGNQWVQTNPTDWIDRTTVTVNAGLGFNDKATKIQLLASLLEYQKEALGIGMANAQNIYKTLSEMVEAAGLGDAGQFFVDPSTVPPQEPQPDPQMEFLKAQLQIEQGKLQNQAEKNMLDVEKAKADLMERNAKFQRDQEQWAKELELKQQQLEKDRMALYMQQHQHDQDVETKLIDILARHEDAQAQAQAKQEAGEELNDLDKAAIRYLGGDAA